MGTFVTERPTKIVTVPVGYGDGYPRSLSNKGFVLIHGKRGADPRTSVYGSVYGRCVQKLKMWHMETAW